VNDLIDDGCRMKAFNLQLALSIKSKEQREQGSQINKERHQQREASTKVGKARERERDSQKY